MKLVKAKKIIYTKTGKDRPEVIDHMTRLRRLTLWKGILHRNFY